MNKRNIAFIVGILFFGLGLLSAYFEFFRCFQWGETPSGFCASIKTYEDFLIPFGIYGTLVGFIILLVAFKNK